MALQITITDAGRAEIINAENTGTDPVVIAEIGLGTGQYVPSESQTALTAEFKRLDTFGGSVVAADVISIAIRDDSADVYEVSEFGLYTASGTLLAVYSVVGTPFFDKAAQSILLLAVDIKLTTLDAASLTFGDINFVNPPATETVMGVAELATQAEVQAGTDTQRIVTPAGLASRTATETRTGLVELATNTEVQTGSDTARAVTPSGLSSRTATTTRTGLVELATDAEGQTGTDTARAVTPAVMRADSATANTPNRVVRRGTSGEIAVGDLDVDGSAAFSEDISVNGLTVGRGSGNFLGSVAVGSNALGTANTSSSNTAVGANTLAANTSGQQNVAVGQNALEANTTGSRNTALGFQALPVANGNENTAVGRNAGALVSSGTGNTLIGHNAGSSLTTGNSHTIIGGFSGNQGGLDIRTANNFVVLSDGVGNLRAVWNQEGDCAFGSTTIAPIGSSYKTVKLNGLNGAGFRLYEDEVERARWYCDEGGAILETVGALPLRFQTNGVEFARGTDAGNLLINKTTDDGVHKLQVNGLVSASTAPQFDDDTTLANTAFVQRALGSFSNFRGITTNDSLTAADAGRVIYASSTSGTITLSLPAANSMKAGAKYEIYNTGVNDVVVTRVGSDTIVVSNTTNTVTSVTLKPGDSIELICLGAGTLWYHAGGTAQLKHASGQFGASLASSGYQLLPSGLIMQWGTVTRSTPSVTVSLPIAFPTSGLHGFATNNDVNGDAEIAVTSVTTTQITVLFDASSTVATASYLAFGY